MPPSSPTTPACSVVIPVYEDKGFLLEALAGCVAQTLDTWEAIVVDDGSASASVSETVAAIADPRVRILIHDSNRGLAAARNTGIREALTDLIVNLDADDILAPDYLAEMLPYLGPESEFNVAFPDFETFGSARGVVRWGGDDLSTLLRYQWIPGPGVAFRRSLWAAVGGYWEDARLRAGNEDREFWIATLNAGLHPVHIPKPLYRYRIGHASMMTQLDRVAWSTHEAIHRRHLTTFEKHGASRAFLADGYLKSAEATRALGHRREAIGLALRGLGQQPWRLAAFQVIGRAVLPEALHRRLRAMRSGSRPA